jgi:hypothetical protein
MLKIYLTAILGLLFPQPYFALCVIAFAAA